MGLNRFVTRENLKNLNEQLLQPARQFCSNLPHCKNEWYFVNEMILIQSKLLRLIISRNRFCKGKTISRIRELPQEHPPDLWWYLWTSLLDCLGTVIGLTNMTQKPCTWWLFNRRRCGAGWNINKSADASWEKMRTEKMEAFSLFKFERNKFGEHIALQLLTDGTLLRRVVCLVQTKVSWQW